MNSAQVRLSVKRDKFGKTSEACRIPPQQMPRFCVPLSGPCKAEVASLCSDITAGNRSLVRCVGAQVTALKANKEGQGESRERADVNPREE